VVLALLLLADCSREPVVTKQAEQIDQRRTSRARLATGQPTGKVRPGSSRPLESRRASVAFRQEFPRGIPRIAIPADNPMTVETVALGRRLFYDRRLSGNGRFACATCHQQRRAFTDGRAHAVGSTGGRHHRSTMSLTNVGYNSSFGWADDSVRTLEDQMKVPLFNEHPVEMGLSGRVAEVVSRFTSAADDVERFRAAFPENPAVSLDNIIKAIAAFERTLISGDSPLDRYLYRDDRSGMSASALRGMELFFSDRLRCVTCHAGFNLSGPVVFESSRNVSPLFHDTGLAPGGGDGTGAVDRGLFARTRKQEDAGRFRAPTLRNIAVTAPYMHDGRLPTLEAVIAHYASGGKPSDNRSRLLRPFTLSPDERKDLIAFLESLTDTRFLTNPDFADPGSTNQLSAQD